MSIARFDAAALVPVHGPIDRSVAGIAQTLAYLNWLETTLGDAARDAPGMVEVMDLPLRN